MTRSLFYAGDHASEELRGGAHGAENGAEEDL